MLRYGGVYADVDTECGSPLDNIILPDDTFLAGWEDEYATADAALDYKFSRQRQLLQWVFAATPGHPALQVNASSSWRRSQAFAQTALIIDQSAVQGGD